MDKKKKIFKSFKKQKDANSDESGASSGSVQRDRKESSSVDSLTESDVRGGSDISLERVKPVPSKGLESIITLRPTTSNLQSITSPSSSHSKQVVQLKDESKRDGTTQNFPEVVEELSEEPNSSFEKLHNIGRKFKELNAESFVDDEDEDTDHSVVITHVSVLEPVTEAYNKQERIRQANIDLFKEEIISNERTVKFNDKVCFLESTDTIQLSECSEDEYDSEHLPERVIKNKFIYLKETSDDEDDTSIDSSDNYEEDEVREDENVGTIEEKKSVYEESPENVNPKIPENSNTQLLLVKVPDTNVVVDQQNGFQSDGSSSENEDVCFGYSEREEICLNQESRNNNYSKDAVKSNVDIEIVGEQKESEEFYENPSTDARVFDISETKKKNTVCTENRKLNIDLIRKQQVSEISVVGDSENISISPKNNTGIKIKITCPDCCEKYSKLSNDITSSDTVDLKQSVDSEHDCENSHQSKVNVQSKRKSGSFTLQPEFVNSKMHNKIKTNESVKNACTNISISLLHTSNDTKGFFKNNHKTINCINKEQKVLRNDTRCKRNVVNDCLQSEQFVLKKTTSLVKQNIVIDSFCTKNIGTRENEKHSRVLICNAFKSKALKSESNSRCNNTNGRPSSCSFEQRDKLSLKRPETAPVVLKRDCCTLTHVRLPKYNGYRSEYGLTEEQLQERKRLKNERIKIRKQKKEEKLAEDERKRKENEQTFSAWLAKKNELAKRKRSQTQMYPRYNFRRYSTPANHVLKSHILQWKPSSMKLGKHFCVDKLLNDATPQEKRTYRIYLGLGAE